MPDNTQDVPPTNEQSDANLSQEKLVLTDLTVAEVMYPVASSLFQVSLKPLLEIKDVSYVFLDANILLQPYQRSAKGRAEIQRTYTDLSQQKRLFVAGQAAREFAKNRTSLLRSLYEELRALKEHGWVRPTTKKFNGFDKEILKWLGEKYNIEEKRQVANKAIDELSVGFDKVQSAVKPLLDAVESMTSDLRDYRWNDPVSEMYTSILTSEMVIEPLTDRESIKKDYDYRDQHKIPPGFGDTGKRDPTHPYGGIGDLLIWYSMLDKAAADSKHIIFVSGETSKGDWWVANGSTPLFPRFELVDEFYRKTNGCSFHIINFSEFLALYKVSDDIVKEVREEEAEQEIINVSTLQQVTRFTSLEVIAGSAVEDWLRGRYPIVYQPQKGRYDFAVLPIEGSPGKYAVEVKVYQVSQNQLGSRLSIFIRNSIQELEDAVVEPDVDGYLLVLVFPNATTAEFAYQQLAAFVDVLPSFSISFGFLDKYEYKEVALVKSS